MARAAGAALRQAGSARVRRFLLLAIVWIACARPYPPPGGEPDQLAPAIIATTPEPLAIVPDFTGPVIFQFDERISERGISDALVIVSPATGDFSVKRGRSEIEISLEGGWRPNTVYRVVLLPGVRDLFNNERREPAELVFSTGADLTDAAIAGFVMDRITGEAADGVVVEAVQRTDSVRYVTVGDTAAFFALTHLPVGTYDVRAWVDGNGNLRLDPSEPLARSTAITLNTPADTLPVELTVVPQDTTPARLMGARAVDSMAVQLQFDDYLELDPTLPPTQVSLLQLPDSVPIPGTGTIVHPVVHEARQRAAADTSAADTARVAAPIAGRRPEPTDTLALRPTRELVFVPPRPLPPGTRFLITVGSVLNVSTRYGGGGTAEFETPEPAPPPAQRDTGTAWPISAARSRR